MVLIDAIYINKSGGKVLLEYFIDKLLNNKQEDEYYFLFDNRLKLTHLEKLNFISHCHLPPSEFKRKEFYKNNIHKFQKIFCFANVPPPVIIKNKPTYIFFHNTLLLETSISTLPFINKIILFIKRAYIKYISDSDYNWIVQTENISKVLSLKLNISNSKIYVLPIFNVAYFQQCNKQLIENNKNYLFVADGSMQKNHIFLLDSWEMFSKNHSNSNLVLHLTLPSSTSHKLLNKIKYLQLSGVNIINHGNCTIEEIKELYTKCNYLIYPSLTESFGLPLIEASVAGCKIIAANLPYVFQVIKPSLTFNPHVISSLENALLSSMNFRNVQPTILLVENKIDFLINKLSYV